jgi:hypothetical protein
MRHSGDEFDAVDAARPSDDDLRRFVYRESRLIDEKRFDDWYELFTEDAFYWVPLVPGQPDGDNHTSLAYEDKLLLRLRIERLRNPEVPCPSIPRAVRITCCRCPKSSGVTMSRGCT